MDLLIHMMQCGNVVVVLNKSYFGIINSSYVHLFLDILLLDNTKLMLCKQLQI